jgi:hypothetical protein
LAASHSNSFTPGIPIASRCPVAPENHYIR